MRQKILFFSFIFLNFTFYIGLKAQDTWIQTYQPFYNPNGDNDYYVEDIRLCPDGGFAITGYYSYFDDWEEYSWGYLMKTDSEGNFLWAKKDSLTFYNNPEPTAFIVLNDGSFITAGWNFAIGGGHYLLKRDSEGEKEWEIDLGNDYSIEAMELTENGNLITTGSSMDNTINLQKFNLNGNLIWRETYLPDGFEYGGGNSVIQTSDGGFALTGSIHGTNNNDIIVIKTDTFGDSLWSWTFDGYGLNDKGNCIIETNDNCLLIGGYLNYTPPVYQYGFLGKFDLLGNNLFIHQFEIWHIRSCLQDNDNNYVIYSGHAMLKTNDFGDTLWCNGFPYFSSYGDRCFQKIEDEFICLSSPSADYIELTKTDSIGNVTSSDENVIIPFVNNDIVCFPNPFNPMINFEIKINNSNILQVEIFNIKGQFVKIIPVEGKNISWNAEDNASGIYLCKLVDKKTGNTLVTKKITLLK